MQVGNMTLLLFTLGYVPIILIIAGWNWWVKLFTESHQTEQGKQQAANHHKWFVIGSRLLLWLYTLVFVGVVDIRLILAYGLVSALVFFMDTLRRRYRLSWIDMLDKVFTQISELFVRLTAKRVARGEKRYKERVVKDALRRAQQQQVTTPDESTPSSFTDDIDTLIHTDHDDDLPQSLTGAVQRPKRKQPAKLRGGWKSV